MRILPVCRYLRAGSLQERIPQKVYHFHNLLVSGFLRNFQVCFRIMGKHWEEFKPVVSKTILVLIAGLVWIMTGTFLSRLAIIWWQSYTGSFLSLFIILGLILGMIKGYYVFSGIVRKNIDRISRMDRNGFVLAFIPWKTYLLIIAMMTFGMTLRHSALPKQYLAIIYMAVGFAMVLSGFQYFTSILRGDIRGN
jgi:uncharacterized membrane protein